MLTDGSVSERCRREVSEHVGKGGRDSRVVLRAARDKRVSLFQLLFPVHHPLQARKC